MNGLFDFLKNIAYIVIFIIVSVIAAAGYWFMGFIS